MLQRESLVQGPCQAGIPVRIRQQAYRHCLGVDRGHSCIGICRQEAEEQMIADRGIGLGAPCASPATPDPPLLKKVQMMTFCPT